MSQERPSPTSMEGMIWNANHMLENALKPNVNGLPKSLFDKCVGIVIVNTVQGGFIFSGTVGSGIAMKKTATGWSPPCAIGLGGIGFGLLAGLSASDVVFFIMDDETMASIVAKHGFSFGADVQAAVGPIGRAAEISDILGGGELGATFAIAYSKGLYAGFQAKGAKMGVREFVNNKFYGSTASGKDIVFTPNSVVVPEGKVTMLQEVYDKLNKCAAGATAEPSAEEESKKEAAKEVAEQESSAMKSAPEAGVVSVLEAQDAENAREASAS